MAQKAVREVFGKKLLEASLSNSIPLAPYKGVTVTRDNISKFKLPVFKQGYVAKPDELFGKRGKNNLIFIDKNPAKVLQWIKTRMSKPVSVVRNSTDKGITGVLSTFLVEPFVAHQQEYYVAIKTARDSDILYFSARGGIDIEAHWDAVRAIPLTYNYKPAVLPLSARKALTAELNNDGNAELVIKFIAGLHYAFHTLDFSYLELNPFTVVDGQVHILDLVARLDDAALYQNEGQWARAGKLEFPEAFGAGRSEAERKVAELDKKSGASLKLTILNPDGRIWLLTSGGGGSVIFADTVADLGYGSELANYGEYSGNPSYDETTAYAKIVLGEMLKSKAKHKILLIGGGIANFTDIKETFRGLVTAILPLVNKLKAQKVKIYVRRGGPNYREGLAYIKTELAARGLPIEVYGPETYMTEIVRLALS